MTSRDLFAAIDKFLFAPYSPYPVALFRILIGLLILETIVLHSVDDFYLYYGPNAILPVTSIAKNWWHFDPAIDWMVLLPRDSSATILFFVVFCFICVAVVVGLFTAYTVPLCFLMLLSIHRQFPYNINGGDAMMLLSMFLLSFSRSGDALSFDNLIRSLRQDWRKTGFAPRLSPAWPTRMLQLQLTLAYLDTFLWKFSGPKWLDGSAVYWATRMQDFMRFPLPPFLDNPFCLKIFTWGTLLVEFSLTTLIWFRETRYAVLLAGLCLHIGIDLFINLPVFEWVFISMMVLFIYPEDLARFAAFIRSKVAQQFGPPRTLTYDGHCILCVRSTGIFHRLDVFRRIKLVDFTDGANRELLENFDFERAQSEMLLLTDKGWVGGFGAFKAIAHDMPMFWILVPFLHLPGVSFLGDKVYKAVARNRYLILGRCDSGACEIHKSGGTSNV